MRRREFLELLGTAAALPLAARLHGQTPSSLPSSKADATLHISPITLEIAPGKIIKTVGYNGSAPGPVLRLREGQRVTIEVFNDTKEPELVHWHGLFVPSEVDGSAEEGTLFIAPHGSQRYSFVPRPAGTRWYHTHVAAGRNLERSTFTGQFGVLYVEPGSEPGGYDLEVFLTLHGWEPYLSASSAGEGSLEAVYRSYSVNGRALGHGDPIRVREGQKVLFRIVNSSATLQHRIALPGHHFTVLSLDGNPVPSPRSVESITLGVAERVDAMVTMNAPGVWVLGETDDEMRGMGLGIVVEYENKTGPPQWKPPAVTSWDYTLFGSAGNDGTPPPASRVPDEIVPLVFRQKFAGHNWVDHWTINGKEFPKTDPVTLRAGKKYRLRFDNQSDDDHPVHLHRHSFEITKYAGKSTSGILKDVVVVPRRAQVEVDFVADNPGLTLFHCHQQLHMDFGFMTLFKYAG
jgi:FtsP/CotA-like multicopper oxidase with cupredoxin domain